MKIRMKVRFDVSDDWRVLGFMIVCAACASNPYYFPVLGRKVTAGIVWRPWKLALKVRMDVAEGLGFMIVHKHAPLWAKRANASDFPVWEGKVSACIVGGSWKLALGSGWMLPTTGGSGSCDSVLFPLAISQVHKACKSVQFCSLWGRLWLEFSEGHKYWHGHLKHQVGCC